MDTCFLLESSTYVFLKGAQDPAGMRGVCPLPVIWACFFVCEKAPAGTGVPLIVNMFDGGEGTSKADISL